MQCLDTVIAAKGNQVKLGTHALLGKAQGISDTPELQTYHTLGSLNPSFLLMCHKPGPLGTIISMKIRQVYVLYNLPLLLLSITSQINLLRITKLFLQIFPQLLTLLVGTDHGIPVCIHCNPQFTVMYGIRTLLLLQGSRKGGNFVNQTC